jgi:hypothetical protein
MQSKKSLLIVDDDFAHRTMLRMLLNWQYETGHSFRRSSKGKMNL